MSNRYYHDDLSRFGSDLNLVFSGTRPMKSCTPNEWKIIEKAIKRCELGKNGMIDTSEWGVVSFITSLVKVIEFLSQCNNNETGECVFAEYCLPDFDSSTIAQGFDKDHGMTDWDDVWINYKAQRTINVLNIVKHLFRFNPRLVRGAFGRKDPITGKKFINDGQHGTLLLGIVGAEKVPVAYVLTDEESTDFDHFLAFNVDNYDAEDYDKHRNQVERSNRMVEEDGVQNILREDLEDYYIDKLFKQHRGQFIPKSRKNIGGGESHHIRAFLSYMDTYVSTGKDGHYITKNSVLDHAIHVARMAWPGHGIPHEPIWGLCELIQSQPKMSDREFEKLKQNLALVIKTKWPGGPDKVWPEVNATIQTQMPKNNPQWRDDFRIQSGNRGFMIGQAFFELYVWYDKNRQDPKYGNQRGFGVPIVPVKQKSEQDRSFEYPQGFPFANINFAKAVA